MSQRKMRFFYWACLALLPACVDLPRSTATGRPRPPPEPGSSITHSRLCSCRACGEPQYCSATDPEPDAPARACGDSYDFSASEGCGMQVETHTSRCFERVWRVKLSQQCDQSRPPECCG